MPFVNRRMQASFMQICWLYVIPSICVLSGLANVLNALVLLKLHSCNNIYYYILVKSISNVVYLLSCSFIVLVKCNEATAHIFPCYLWPHRAFFIAVYELYVYHFLTSALGLFDLLLEMFVALNRLCIIVNKQIFVTRLNAGKVCAGLAAFAFVFYTPLLFILKIEPQQYQQSQQSIVYYYANYTQMLPTNLVGYHLNFVDYKYRWIYEKILLAGLLLRGGILVVLVICMNLLGSCLYRRVIHDKLNLNESQQGNSI